MQKVRVLVERGPHAVIPTEVFDYELPILEELHTTITEDGRKPYQPKDIDGKDCEFDVGDAYRGLHVKYNQPDAQLALNKVYPTESVFARAVAASEPAQKRKAA